MKKLILFFCTLWFFCTAFSQETDYGHWVMADSMNFVTHGASTVLQSSKVLVAGEGAVCELYDCTINKWVVTDSLLTKRKGRRLLTLQDGRALAISGTTNEVFDETTEDWTTVASFNLSSRHSGTATLLNDGTVLYAGGMLDGNITSSCELYDPVADTWTIVDSMNTERIYHAALLLQDGRVLVSGGESYSGYLKACEIFDPNTQMWYRAAPLNKSRWQHVPLLLPDGRALVLGTTLPGYDNVRHRDVEIYDKIKDIWILKEGTLTPGVDGWKGNAFCAGENRILYIKGSSWGYYDTSTWMTTYHSYRELSQSNVMIERLENGIVIAMGGQATRPGALIPHSRACEIYHPTSTGINIDPEKILQNFFLYQNYPNPFNPSTYIHFSLKESTTIELNVFDVKGQFVKELARGFRAMGEHQVIFDAYDLPSGVYFCMLKVNHHTRTIKVLKLN